MKVMEDGTVVFENPADEASGAPDGRVPWEVAACHYWVNVGNIAATARRYQTTVYEIKKLMSQPWWQEEVNKVKSESRVKIDAGFTRIVEKSITLLEDRLENGEITSIKELPNGTKVIKRSAIRAVDIAKIMDTAFMKRQLVRNEPTVVAGDTQALSVLAQKLRALGRKDPALLDTPTEGSAYIGEGDSCE